MSADSAWFRELYHETFDYEGPSLYDDLLGPWTEKAQSAMSECARFKQPFVIKTGDEESRSADWNLYALNRAKDLLLLQFQEPLYDKSQVARTSPDEYERFFLHLGFEVCHPERFTPFRHEIVRVHQSAEDDEPIQVVDFLWPSLMFGELMFSRAGVEVTAGRNYCVKEVAERSSIYFTHRRAARRAFDQSHGWGSNSQWRTSIRRDYESAGRWIYNFEGKEPLHDPHKLPVDPINDLPLAERIELLKHRSFVTTTKPHDDLYPYSDWYEEAVAF